MAGSAGEDLWVDLVREDAGDLVLGIRVEVTSTVASTNLEVLARTQAGELLVVISAWWYMGVMSAGFCSCGVQ